jgi:hypothetical protein
LFRLCRLAVLGAGAGTDDPGAGRIAEVHRHLNPGELLQLACQAI